MGFRKTTVSALKENQLHEWRKRFSVWLKMAPMRNNRYIQYLLYGLMWIPLDFVSNLSKHIKVWFNSDPSLLSLSLALSKTWELIIPIRPNLISLIALALINYAYTWHALHNDLFKAPRIVKQTQEKGWTKLPCQFLVVVSTPEEKS